MLEILLKDKITKLRASNREAARQIGISHTTLNRILEGGDYDLTTLIQICGWLNINPATLLGTMTPNPDQLASQIAVFLEGSPEIAKVMRQAMERVVNGRMSPETLRDLVAYTAYKLQIADGGRIEPNIEEEAISEGGAVADTGLSNSSNSRRTSRSI